MLTTHIMKLRSLALILCLISPSLTRAADYDVVVYGGTSAGVIAAVQAKKMGKSVILVSPDKHLGGLSSGGLGFTDTGNKAVIGGLARDFYHRVWLHYDQSEAWKWQKKAEYGNKGQGTPAIDGDQRTMWIFEPHVAEQIFEEYIRECSIPVQRDEWLDRAKGVKKEGARIVSITTLSGKSYKGRMFIDATYEGDLMAAAGVDYHVGREASSVYGEEANGCQVGTLHHRHHFGVLKEKISPYIVPGDPKSGVLPHVSAEPPGEHGQGDKRVQAYCFRMCLTDLPENRLPLPKPDGYDPKQYELLLRVFNAGWRETFEKFDPIPNHKTDTNNHGPFSTDNVGANYDYPDASYERRREIIKEHTAYQQGWLYFIATDPRVPKEVQEQMQRWGLPKDEFQENANWSWQLYIREARRMIGSYVMTENELLKKHPTPDSVGMGSYTIDSHNCQRYITPEGYVQNEGDIGVHTPAPYEIAYGALVPKRGQADNLLVPICVSSSHIAFGSIRMEPVFMILGQSAATAAVLAMDGNQTVQELPYAKLRERLLEEKQILEWTPPAKSAASKKESTSSKPAATSAAKPLDHVGQLAAALEPTRVIVYKKVGDRELHLNVFEPEGLKPTDHRACFLSIHGGGWTGMEPRRQYPFAAHFAKLGLVGISIEYRLAKSDGSITVFDCVKDVRSALRYVRAHAAELGVDPQKIIANGGSAGGHLAASTALFDGVDENGEEKSVSCAPNALVLYFPVIDTSKEGYGNGLIGPRWQEISPLHQVRANLPPTIIFHGTGDTVTPFKGAKAFQEAMLKAGNRCELVVNDGGAHGYLMRDRALYEETLQKSEAFLATLGLLKETK